MALYNPTRASLEEWRDFVEDDVLARLNELMDDEWDDLPPDVCRLLIDASNALADVRDAVKKHLLGHEDADD